MRRVLAVLVGVVMLSAACSGDSSSITESSATTATSGAVTSEQTTTTAPLDVTETTSSTLADLEDHPFGTSGSTGLGDPYFPGLGNGGYDVEHYLIDLRIDPDRNLIDGTTTIEAVATEDLASLNLDFRGLEIREVDVDGVEVPHLRADSELTVTAPLPAGETFSLSVEYFGRPEAYVPESFGFPMGWIPSDEGAFVAAQPAGAMTWFPANDHPSDKAAFTFVITVPVPYTAAASGLLVETIEGGDETTFVWEMDDPMATYLATVVVAELERVEYPGPEGIILRDYLRPDLALDPPAAFRLIPEMLAVFEDAFGPYPFDAYGHVVVPDWPAALETQTLTVFGDDWFGLSIVEYVVAHELAHSWFGDSLTPATWQDIWLNEGFATYAEWIWLEHRWGREAMLSHVRDTYDGLHGSTLGLTGDPGLANMFGDAVYERGGLTLHALRAEIGDDLFFDLLRAWTERHAYGNVRTEDFIALAEEVVGRPLHEVLDPWLYQQPLPQIPLL